MSERERDLVPAEGVDEASAASTPEGDVTPDPGADVVGRPGHGGPVNDEQDAGPDPVETPESRRAHDGQQLAVGEG